MQSFQQPYHTGTYYVAPPLIQGDPRLPPDTLQPAAAVDDILQTVVIRTLGANLPKYHGIGSVEGFFDLFEEMCNQMGC